MNSMILPLKDTQMEEALAAVNYSCYVQYTNDKYEHGRHTRFLSKKMQEIEKKHSEGIPTFTIISLPPRHSKSFTITETFPSWFIGRDPSRRVIQVSYGASLARKFGLANLRKMEGKAGKIFGLELDDRKSAANNWTVKNHSGGMLSSGIGGSLTGEGGDLIVLDDPIRNRKDANSAVYRESLWNEWLNTISTRLQPNGSVIIILTRWHEDDLAGRILEKDPRDWEYIRLPAIAEENDILGRDPGEPLWPEQGFDAEWAKTTKTAVGPIAWESLYQQHPRPQAGSLLKRQYWKFYKEPPNKRAIEKIIFSWDCAFKDLETSDYVVGQVWAKVGADFYLLDQTRDKMGITATMTAIEAMKAKWPMGIGVYIEDKANGTAVIEMLKRKISGINPVSPSNSKVDRVQAVLPLVAAGNVYLPDPSICEWVGDFIGEAASFPYGKNDDQVDCMTQALNVMYEEKTFFIGRA